MKRDLGAAAACGGLYWLNRLWLRNVTGGWVQWFLVCYFSDVLAGAALAASVDLMLLAAGRRELTRARQVVPLLLLAGLVWECLTPLWKAGAVFDPWDFLAYQAGGALYLLQKRLCMGKEKSS